VSWLKDRMKENTTAVGLVILSIWLVKQDVSSEDVKQVAEMAMALVGLTAIVSKG